MIDTNIPPATQSLSYIQKEAPIFPYLPIPIGRHIFSYLDPQDLIRLRCLSKAAQFVIDKDPFLAQYLLKAASAWYPGVSMNLSENYSFVDLKNDCLNHLKKFHYVSEPELFLSVFGSWKKMLSLPMSRELWNCGYERVSDLDQTNLWKQPFDDSHILRVQKDTKESIALKYTQRIPDSENPGVGLYRLSFMSLVYNENKKGWDLIEEGVHKIQINDLCSQPPFPASKKIDADQLKSFINGTPHTFYRETKSIDHNIALSKLPIWLGYRPIPLRAVIGMGILSEGSIESLATLIHDAIIT